MLQESCIRLHHLHGTGLEPFRTGVVWIGFCLHESFGTDPDRIKTVQCKHLVRINVAESATS